MRKRRARAPVLSLALACLTAGACRSSGPPDSSPVEREVRVAPIIAPAQRSGLEVAWWITEDRDAALGPKLLALAPPDQRFDPDTIERLRAAGLRPVRLDEPALLELTSAAPPVGGIDRLWIGLESNWTPARLPTPMDATAPRPIESIGTHAAPGALRLLWRAYIAAEDLDPVLRVDMLGQVISTSYARDRFDATRARLPRPIDAGPTVENTRSTFVLRPGEVIVLVGEAPGADWSAPPAAPSLYDPDAPPPGVGIEVAPPERTPIDAYDPPPPPESPTIERTPPLPQREAPAPRTFGQALLTAPVPGDPTRAGRLIVVLIPQVPEQLQIIPRGPDAPAR